MFVRSLNALALASLIVFGQCASTAQPERHGTTSTDTSPSSQNCILGLKSTTVYCPRDIEDLDLSIDLTALPLLKDIHEEWRELNAVDLARLPTRSDLAVEPALPVLLDRDSQIGGTNNFALVCLYDQGLTNNCQKNWAYYCDANGGLHTTKEDREEGCDLCECIDLNPKPACILGMTGALYCQRDIHDKELWSKFRSYVPDTTAIENLPDNDVEGSEPDAKDGTKSSEMTGILPEVRD